MLGADVNSSPVKGKAKDDGRWRSSWWDFHPLVENIQRPVAWSTSSVIFTAHSSQPLLLGRLFPSSKQFVVPSPEPVLRSLPSFEPPSVISVAPNDQWLFAFYPGLEGDGIACLWKRGYQVDSWTVKECWPMGPGAGVITAAWAGVEREWITSSDGSCSRLPLCGPLTPVSSPTLLLVTQSHELHVCYARPYSPSLSFLCCSLVQPYFITEGHSRAAFHDVPSGPKSSRLCIKAAIGLMYAGALAPVTHNDSDLGLTLDASHEVTSEEQSPPLDWGALAEEQTIELCEVKLRFDGSAISLISYPLTPIYHSSLHLTNLEFTCAPLPKPDPSASPKSSPRKDKQPARPITDTAAIYLVVSFFDYDDYNSIPKSEMMSYSVSRIPPSPTVKSYWSIRHTGERSFLPRVVLSFAPGWSPCNPRKSSIIVMLADIAGSRSRGGSKAKEVPVGSFTVLQLPDLSDDEGWDRPRIMSPVSRAGMDWPVSIAMSVNRTLLCAVSMTRVSIHCLPRPYASNADLTGTYGAGLGSLSPLAMTLTSAMVSRKSIADVAHILCTSSTSAESVIETFSGLLLAQEVNARSGGAASFTFMEVIGVELEVYKYFPFQIVRTRARAASTTDEDVKEYLTSLWKNAHTVCSVASTLSAFESCKDEEGYDLDVVWQLVSLSEWAVTFLENIMKECLLLSDMTDIVSKEEIQLKPEPMDDNPFLLQSTTLVDAKSPFDNPALLHLVHPLLLANLINMISHVNQIYQWLNSVTAKGESAQMARDALLDVVDYSGLNLEALEDIFKNVLKEVSTMPGEQTRPSLARCHPVPAQHYRLQTIIQTLSSSAAINKPRLFIKPSDLVDGFTNLSVTTPSWKEQGRDVVTKGQLLRRGIGVTCLRCGQESEVGGELGVPVHVLSMWRSWESMWMTRCVCGGSWVGGKM
ncbi:hypothetical protein EV401DRAFT_1862628 [Pisolithus croceorrhizus]|nr:hypothetical protein EV401DRAFT_1862628 [Pisolithus croceorrhizus]